MAREKLEKVIEQIVKNRGSAGAALEDVRTELQQLGHEKSPSLIRTILRRLALEHQLVAGTRATGRPGNPELVYYHIDFAQEVMGLQEPVRRAEIEQELHRREVMGGLAPLIDSALRIMEGDPVMKAVRSVALDLANENPRDLYLQMADWVVNRAYEIEARFLNARQQEERRILMDKLQLLAELVDRLFRRMLNIDPFTFRINPYALDRDTRVRLPEQGHGEDVVTYDRGRVQQLLGLYVFGERVVEVESVAISDKVFSVASTDASVQEIPLWQEIPSRASDYWATREVHALTTSAASLQIPDPRSQPLFDFDIDPRRLQEYDTQASILEGLLLPGDIMHRLGPDKWTRCKYAAMNIRQYRHDEKVLRGEGAWRQSNMEFVSIRSARLLKPTVLFRDGRLFPLEHRLDNYEGLDLYGAFVRRSVAGLAILSAMPRVSWGECVVTGVVKDAVLSVFAPLILWYAHIKKPDDVDEDTLLSAPYPDGHLIEPILKAKTAQVGFAEGQFVITFRVLRRFSTLAGKRIERARFPDGTVPVTPAEWEAWFEKVYFPDSTRLDETELDPSDYREFVYLCGHIGALEFFLHPADGRLQPSYKMPRYEILVSSEDRREFLIRKERHCVQRILAALAPKDSLNWDDTHSNSDWPVMIPSVLIEADRAAAFASGTFKRMLIATIWELYQGTKKDQ